MKSEESRLQDKIQCQLCGKWFYQITWHHLLAKHNVTTHEYKEAFGIESFWPEWLRNAKTTWTREKIIEEIRKRYRNGDPLNYRHMNTTRFWVCVTAAKRYFKDWGEAVEAAGINYEEVSIQKSWESLQTVNPKLATEWHPTKNDDLTPRDVKAFSGRKVWWQCKRGHEWEAKISNRSNGRGCPYCGGKLASKDYNLRLLNPDVAEEWHPTKNGSLRPEGVVPGSDKKVWWLCSRGHEWQAPILHRKRGASCPYCKGRRKPLRGED